MTRLWLLLGVALMLAWIIQQRDLSLTLACRRPTRERFATCCLILLLGFFCGLRVWGNDTVTYLQVFRLVPRMDEPWDNYHIDFSDGYGFIKLTSWMKTVGFTSQDYLMFFAFLTIISYVMFLRRYSVNIVFSVFLLFATGMYTFTLAAIKQTTATAFCLWAIPMALDRKWLRFFLLVGLGSLFHPYALVYLIVPLMIFEPWKGKTILYIVIFTSAGFLLEPLLGTVLSVTDMMGAEYTTELMLGAGVNIFRVLVSFVPLILAVFFGGILFKDAGQEVWLMFNLAMVNALIMFVGLFGTANYFARLANYFLPAQVIILPWMIQSAHLQDRRWLLPTSIVGYAGYFFYENAINRQFDTEFAHTSLWKYLDGLFEGLLR